MSHMQKALARLQQKEGPAFGFGATRREAPKQILLAVAASDAAAVTAGIDAGADLAVIAANDGAAAAAIIRDTGKAGRCGARLGALDEAGAAALREAGAVFAIAAPEKTAAVAVDTDALGYIANVAADIAEDSLRAIAALGVDGLTLDGDQSPESLADQLHLVRLAQLGGAGLMLQVSADITTPQLRTLRDAGAGIVIAPAGATPDQVKELVARIKALPPKRKGREGGDIALVPSARARAEEEHDHEDDDE